VYSVIPIAIFEQMPAIFSRKETNSKSTVRATKPLDQSTALFTQLMSSKDDRTLHSEHQNNNVYPRVVVHIFFAYNIHVYLCYTSQLCRVSHYYCSTCSAVREVKLIMLLLRT